jgi:hypothetical protein
MFIDMENKTAFVINTAVTVTRNLPNTETEKITKYGHLALEIKNIWKLNVSVYPLVILAEVQATKSFLKCILRVGQKAVVLLKCHTLRKFLGHAP